MLVDPRRGRRLIDHDRKFTSDSQRVVQSFHPELLVWPHVALQLQPTGFGRGIDRIEIAASSLGNHGVAPELQIGTKGIGTKLQRTIRVAPRMTMSVGVAVLVDAKIEPAARADLKQANGQAGLVSDAIEADCQPS